MKSRTLIHLILILSGIVVGTLVSELTAGIGILSWLSYGISFGTNGPISINLGVLAFDFGISINLTISCIIFIFIALTVGRKVL